MKTKDAPGVSSSKLVVAPAPRTSGEAAGWRYLTFSATLERNGEFFALVTPDGKNALEPDAERVLLEALNVSPAPVESLQEEKEVNLVKNLLKDSKELLGKLVLIAPGYDWNKDPLCFTSKIGMINERIDQAIMP